MSQEEDTLGPAIYHHMTCKRTTFFLEFIRQWLIRISHNCKNTVTSHISETRNNVNSRISAIKVCHQSLLFANCEISQ